MRTPEEQIKSLRETRDFWLNRVDELQYENENLALVNRQLIKELNRKK